MNKLQFVILTVSLSIISLNIFAQDVTGLWNGTIYNDSTKQDYPYQIAISEDADKLSGYSYTVYDINGKKEIGVRKVKIKRKENKLTVEDVDLIYNNYAEAPPKGVHKISILDINIEDTLIKLNGEWHSNRTKVFFPLSGTITVQKKYDYKNTELFKKLEDLHLDNTLSFTPKPVNPAPDETQVIAKNKEAADKKTKEDKLIADAEKKTIKDAKEAADKKSKEEKLLAETEKKALKEAEEKKRKEDKLMAAAEKKALKEVEEKKKQEEKIVAATKSKTKESIVEINSPAAKDVEKRKIINTQEVFYTSDSLTLTLYDNGDVDGDIVTVLMNGEILMPKVSLTTKPARKTIYITPATPDSLQLVMFAENLGSIPPNTGLLVVNDGNAIYEVRFSADLQTNAAILLRKKKK